MDTKSVNMEADSMAVYPAYPSQASLTWHEIITGRKLAHAAAIDHGTEGSWSAPGPRFAA